MDRLESMEFTGVVRDGKSHGFETHFAIWPYQWHRGSIERLDLGQVQAIAALTHSFIVYDHERSL